MRRAGRGRPLLAALLLALALPLAGGAAQEEPGAGTEGGAPEDPAAALERLREAIEARREKVSAYERREEGLFDAIEAIDGAVRALEAEVTRAGREVAEAERTRTRLEEERDALEVRLAATREALAERAVALYKAGALGAVPVLFAPGSLRDRLSRLQALRRLVDHDERLLARYDAERRALAQAVADAEAARERSEEARSRRRARLAELERERRAKRSLLVDLRQDRARERAVLNELEAAARELEATLEGLRGDPLPAPGAVPFAELRGELDPPVAAPLVRRFGRVVDAQYRTETFRKGVDFGAELGDPVYAVADGSVRFAGWFSGYGRMVIVDHGGGYFTVSGHLDELRVEVGDPVRAGDPLGTAGDTGSLAGPRLYFEIRRGARALDPAEWLRLLPRG